MKHEWWTIPSFLSAEECQRLIATYQQGGVPSSIGSDGSYEPDLRLSQTNWIEDLEPELCDKIVHHILRINDEAFGFDIYPMISELQFTTYKEGGFYDWHVDHYTGGTPSNRKLSIVIQLSDPADYEGGEFALYNHTFDDCKKQGSMIVFPSFTLHRACPVTAGTRYSLVTWIHGQNFR